MKTKITILCTMLLVAVSLVSTQAQERILALQEPFVILIDPADGTILDPSFIDLTPQNQNLPKAIIKVGDELWISDQNADSIYRYDLSGNFLSTITGGMDNIKGMAVVNNNEVWLTNANSNNGAPGDALIRFDFAGNNLGFYDTTASGSAFDIVDTGTEVLVSYIFTGDTKIERRDYNGNILGNLVEENVVNFIQQMEINTANNSVYASVFSNGTNPLGLYEFSMVDGSILNYYSAGALRGVAALDDGNVLVSTGNNINLVNTTTNTSTLLSAGGSSQYFIRATLTPCTPPATPTGDATQTFDEGATLADIVVDPTNVTWYATEMDALNGTNPLDNTTLLEDGETYYAVQFEGGCPSAPFAVTVTVNCIPSATPTGDAVQTFIEGATVGDIVVDPMMVLWYATEADAQNMVNPLLLTALLEDGENYFAVNNANDCPSEPFEVTVNVECLPSATPTGDATQTFPEPATLADIIIDPMDVLWFATEADALALLNELPLTTILEAGENYFAVNMENGCPSEPFEVTIIIEVLGLNDLDSTPLIIYPNPVTDQVTITSTSEIHTIVITNVLGQTVLSKEVHQNQIVLDVSGLSKGLYLLTANAGDKKTTAKIVKE